MDDKTKALEFLENCHFMTIAVIADGRPWAVPVHIAARDDFSFQWDSHPDTVHSRAITDNPQIALSLYRLDDGDVREFGLYAHAEAQKMADLPDGRATYRAVVTEAWVNDERHEKRRII